LKGASVIKIATGLALA